MSKATAPVPVPESLLAYLQTVSAIELEAREDEEGRPHYPFALKRKRANNKGIRETPVMLRTPMPAERVRGTIAACKAIGKLIGRSVAENVVPLTVPQAIEAVGQTHWVSYEALGLASMCIRDDKPGFPQHDTVDGLAERYGLQTVQDALGYLDTLFEREDPKIPAPIPPDLFRDVVIAIAKAGDLGPLAVIAGDAHPSFAISMACQLAPFLIGKSSRPSSEISTTATPEL